MTIKKCIFSIVLRVSSHNVLHGNVSLLFFCPSSKDLCCVDSVCTPASIQSSDPWPTVRIQLVRWSAALPNRGAGTWSVAVTHRQALLLRQRRCEEPHRHITSSIFCLTRESFSSTFTFSWLVTANLPVAVLLSSKVWVFSLVRKEHL